MIALSFGRRASSSIRQRVARPARRTSPWAL